MKKIIVSGILTITALNLSAQSFEISPKLSFGTGRIHSKNLTESFNQRNAIKSDVLTWNVKQKFGFTFSIGGCFQYNINQNIAVIGELSFNSLRQKIIIDYFENDIDGSGDGDKKTITSEAKIKTTWLGFPLLAQYSFGDEQKLRIMGGLEFMFMGVPKIESDETKTTETYVSNALVDTKTEVARISTTLNEFKSPRTNLLLGIGTTFNVSDRNLYLDLRFHLPLTKSQMYTTDWVYDDIAFKNNEVFSVWGKSDAELDAPQYRLDDYKLGTIDIVVRYVLFKK